MKSPRLVRPVVLAITLAGAALHTAPAFAQVSIGVGISLPLPIVFAAPPQVVVLPGYDIYVAPDVAEEIYFVDGYWWRPWQGRWYRSASYDSGWGHYPEVPYFYRNVRQGWRDDYRNHRWEGHSWNYERMPHQRVEQNWSSWKSSRHWEKQQNWGVPERKGNWQRSDDRDREPDSRHRSSDQNPRTQSPPSQKHSSQPKAGAPQHRSSQPRAATQPKQQRSSKPKVAPQQQHSDQPRGASSKHGGAPDQGQKQRSQQPKSRESGQPQGQGQNRGNGDNGDNHQGQSAGQHGGGKDKR